MKLKRVRNILLIVAAVIVGLFLAIQIALNSPIVTKLANKYAAEYVDGNVSWSRIHFSMLRNFPKLSVSIDDLSLTYPHERYAAYDTLGMPHAFLGCGRGAQEDTLASWKRFSASVNLWKLIRKDLILDNAGIESLRAFAHSYRPGAANWDIFKGSDTPKDTTDEGFALPWIKVREISFDNPHLVYTDQSGAIFGSADLSRLGLSGDIMIASDSLEVKSFELGLEDMDLEGGYGYFNEAINTVEAKARLNLKAGAEGSYVYGGNLPESHAELELSSGIARYAPIAAPVALSLAAKATVDRKGRMDAEVSELTARTSGLDFDADASAADLMGKDPLYNVDASALVCLDSLLALMPSDFGIIADGHLDISLDARAHQSELNQYKFDRASISGHVLGDRVRVSMPADTLFIDAHRPVVDLNSDPDGIMLGLNLDSVYVDMGDGLRAKVRDMKTKGRLTKVESNGKMTPHLEVESDNGAIFFRSGDTRAMVRSANIAAAVEKRVHNSAAQARRAPHGGPRPDHTTAEALSGSDIRVAVDSTIIKYIRQWKPSGKLALGKGFVATPSLPLRTRIGEVSAKFDEREVVLDTLAVRCGTSDVSAKGRIGNFMSLFSGRRSRKATTMRLDLDSRRINVNEIIAAFQMGAKDAPRDTSMEYDETFVVDSIADAPTDPEPIGAIILPGNIDAELNIAADKVIYTDIEVAPLKASANLKDRTLQLLNTSGKTNLGDVDLDAYYSTKSLDDLSAGVDIKLNDISAEGIIHMLPSVDEMMPVLKSFKGKLGCEISATAQVDTNMNVLIPTVDGIVRISGRDLEVEDAGDLKKITRLLLFKNKNIGHIDDLNVSAVVHDSKVEVFPFELGVDRYKLALRGMQGLDNTMNYHVSILKSPFLIPFGINMYGTLDNWRFSLGFPKYREGKVPVYSKEIESVQVNIAQSIRNIFQKGVDEVKQYNRKNVRELNQSERTNDNSLLDGITADQYNEVEQLAFEMEAMSWEDDLAAEVDAVLEESFMDMEKLLKTYQDEIYDKRTEKKIEQLKQQSEKKKNKSK